MEDVQYTHDACLVCNPPLDIYEDLSNNSNNNSDIYLNDSIDNDDNYF